MIAKYAASETSLLRLRSWSPALLIPERPSLASIDARLHQAVVALLYCCVVLHTGSVFAVDQVSKGERWWPVQAMPKSIVRVDQEDAARHAEATVMMAQSVAGLAAKAVNDGQAHEMVWAVSGNRIVEHWFSLALKRHPDLQVRRAATIWQVVDQYAKMGIIKGYILYKADASKAPHNERYGQADCSVNVATSLAALFNGILVEEQLEPEAQAHGLERLIDARGKTQAWCFETYESRFNRRLVCTQDPRLPNVRDLAIAQSAFTMYGDSEPLTSVMKWLEPLSPVLGWNGGDEFKTTELSTRWGHLQTATDWCSNLPVLMAGSESRSYTNLPKDGPPTIDWSDHRSAVSFISTDGDNVQWFEDNFFSPGGHYWGSLERGKIPFGWSCCFAQLAQLCPETIDFVLSTRTPHDSLVEWGGGYYYPDLFAADRPNRRELLARHARRTWTMMEKTRTRIIGFNVADCRSPDARKAYQVFAGQTEGLLAILVFQYSPYEAGGGETFWVKDRNGIEIPVITARYSIWEHSNQRERSGTPAKVAREIRQTVEQTPQERLPRYDWVIDHVWSYFKNSPGTDENGENMAQDSAETQHGLSGYQPAKWCAERLPADIRVIGPEEMAWRIRMKHNPSQTNVLLRGRN